MSTPSAPTRSVLQELENRLEEAFEQEERRQAAEVVAERLALGLGVPDLELLSSFSLPSANGATSSPQALATSAQSANSTRVEAAKLLRAMLLRGAPASARVLLQSGTGADGLAVDEEDEDDDGDDGDGSGGGGGGGGDGAEESERDHEVGENGVEDDSGTEFASAGHSSRRRKERREEREALRANDYEDEADLLALDALPRTSAATSTSSGAPTSSAAAAATSSQAASSALRTSHFRAYVTRLESLASSFRAANSALERAEARVRELAQHCASVSAKTEEVRDECQKLLAAQGELLASAQRLRTHLRYFDECDHMTARFDAASTPQALVGSEEFGSLLQRLDDCLDYMRLHAGFREAGTHRDAFRQLHLRALNAVKAYFAATLQAATREVRAQRSSAEGAGLDVQSAAYSARAFVEYRAAAKAVRPLLRDIEARAADSRPYQTLLQQVLRAYVFERGTSRDVESTLAAIAARHPLPDYVRRSAEFVIELCTLEFQLFLEFFSSSEQATEALRDVLAQVCGVFYTQLRPLVIHQPQLETLCEVVTILRDEVLEQQVIPRGEPVAPMANCVRSVLQDVQERIIYRAQVFLRDDVRMFTPAPEDVDYPAKLLAANAAESAAEVATAAAAAAAAAGTTAMDPADGSRSGRGSSSGALNVVSNGESWSGGEGEPPLTPEQRLKEAARAAMRDHRRYTAWYPTLERTLLALSMLYRCLDVRVFQYLAQEAVATCTASLVDAAKQIREQHHGGASAIRSGSVPSRSPSPMPSPKEEVVPAPAPAATPRAHGLVRSPSLQQIALEHPGETHAQLFLVKHLLILREQISPFQVDFAVTEQTLDFSRLRELVPNLLKSTRDLTWRGWRSVLAAVELVEPRLLDTRTDSKKDMEGELKRACEQLITFQTLHFVGPLVDVLRRHTPREMVEAGSAVGASRLDAPAALAELRATLRSMASPSIAPDSDSDEDDSGVGGGVHGGAPRAASRCGALERGLRSLQELMALYLRSAVTEQILFKPVRINVRDVLQQARVFLARDLGSTDVEINALLDELTRVVDVAVAPVSTSSVV